MTRKVLVTTRKVLVTTRKVLVTTRKVLVTTRRVFVMTRTVFVMTRKVFVMTRKVLVTTRKVLVTTRKVLVTRVTTRKVLVTRVTTSRVLVKPPRIIRRVFVQARGVTLVNIFNGSWLKTPLYQRRRSKCAQNMTGSECLTTRCMRWSTGMDCQIIQVHRNPSSDTDNAVVQDMKV